MKRISTLALLLVAMSTSAFSGEDDDRRGCPRGDCRVPTKEVCFNLVCYYNSTVENDFKSCKVAAKFDKKVTIDGGEVVDDSDFHNNPAFEVTCDNSVLYNNSARRFTDMLGTRIQGESGPHPAISLPRGALHSGADGKSGSHVAASIFETDTGSHVQRTQGLCHIWTGAP